MRVHHIGYYVRDLNEAQEEFEQLGYETIQNVVYDSNRKVRICFMRNGTETIELVEPSEGCPYISKSLRKLGSMPYHICYEASDLPHAVRALQGRGYYLVQAAAPAIAIGDRKVVFMYHDAVGLLELLEEDNRAEKC